MLGPFAFFQARVSSQGSSGSFNKLQICRDLEGKRHTLRMVGENIRRRWDPDNISEWPSQPRTLLLWMSRYMQNIPLSIKRLSSGYLRLTEK